MQVFGKRLYVVIFLLGLGYTLLAQQFNKDDRDRAIRTELLLQEYIKSNNQRMDDMKAELKGDIADAKSELKGDIYHLNNSIQGIYWMIGILVTCIIAAFAGFYVMTMKIVNGESYKIKEDVIRKMSSSGAIFDMISELRSASYFEPRVEKILKKYDLIEK